MAREAVQFAQGPIVSNGKVSTLSPGQSSFRQIGPPPLRVLSSKTPALTSFCTWKQPSSHNHPYMGAVATEMHLEFHVM